MNQPLRSAFQENQAGDATFQIVLNGVLPNVSRIDVREKLAALFKATPEQIDKLLATPAYVVKRAISFDVAAKYKSAIEAAGGVCELVPEAAPTISLDVDLPKVSAAAESEKNVTSEKTIIFQGDVILFKSAWSIVQGKGIGTSQKFVFSGDKKGDIVLHRNDVLSAEEISHKWVVKTKAGDTYKFSASNVSAFRQVMLTLSGQEALAQSAHKEPEISAVRNGTAWLAAFGPTISGVIALLVAFMFNGGIPDHWSAFALFKISILKLVLIHLFLKIDSLKLQSQGYNLQQLGVASPTSIFTYLFSRAKAFGQSRAYAITWCVLFAIEVLALFA